MALEWRDDGTANGHRTTSDLRLAPARRGRLAALVIAAAATGTGGCLLWVGSLEVVAWLASGPVATSLDVSVTALTLLAGITFLYLATLFALAAMEIATLGHDSGLPDTSHRGLHQSMARVLAAGLIALMASTTPVAAQSSPSATGSTTTTAASVPGQPVAQMLPTPSWTPGPVATALTLLDQGHEQASDVVVERGDTLWSIAQRRLGPDATPLEIADAWPRWFDANRGVIGDDPHTIFPGQILSIPQTDHNDDDFRPLWSITEATPDSTTKDAP